MAWLWLLSFLLSILPVTIGDYYPDYGYPLERWNKQKVAHWLVHSEFYQLVPEFYTQEIDGAALKTLDKSHLDRLGVVNENQRRRLLQSVQLLQQQIDDNSQPLSQTTITIMSARSTRMDVLEVLPSLMFFNCLHHG
eukprot:m.229717 g.229717  ORF g.229717 m.229717 type:complete len:137 (-) comp17344_c0_seq10:518-928(-)